MGQNGYVQIGNDEVISRCSLRVRIPSSLPFSRQIEEVRGYIAEGRRAIKKSVLTAEVLSQTDRSG